MAIGQVSLYPFTVSVAILYGPHSFIHNDRLKGPDEENHLDIWWTCELSTSGFGLIVVDDVSC